MAAALSDVAYLTELCSYCFICITELFAYKYQLTPIHQSMSVLLYQHYGLQAYLWQSFSPADRLQYDQRKFLRQQALPLISFFLSIFPCLLLSFSLKPYLTCYCPTPFLAKWQPGSWTSLDERESEVSNLRDGMRELLLRLRTKYIC